MRHKVYGKNLGRNKNQRTALFKSLVQSLILAGSIQTTEAKAKSIKPTVDKIINQAKSRNTQRLLQQFLVAKPVREKLVKDIAPALRTRTSGYTSVVKLGPRLGDGAMMVRMSLLTESSVKSQVSSDDKEKVKSQKVSKETAFGRTKIQVKSEKTEKPIERKASTRTTSKKEAAKK